MTYTLRALCLATALLLAGVASAQEKTQASPRATQGAGSMELHAIMEEAGDMPMPMSGDVDRDFAAMMRMHHQQGIRMVDVLLKHGKDPELKRLAQRMKDEQQKEIEELGRFTK
jgi:uncharacterized protein (DUF305 family)